MAILIINRFRAPLEKCAGGCIDFKLIFGSIVDDFAFVYQSAVIIVLVDPDVGFAGSRNFGQSRRFGSFQADGSGGRLCIIRRGQVDAFDIVVIAEDLTGGSVDFVVIFFAAGVKFGIIFPSAVIVFQFYLGIGNIF